MSLAVQDIGSDQERQTDVTGLVYRFWLTFIRQITEPHLKKSGRSKQRNLMDRQLAETVDKAVDLALSGTPPHRCGSFGRAALMVVRGDAKRAESPLGFAMEPASTVTALEESLTLRAEQ